jgi:RimJ/RimL family protein N-acetyltransferase
MKFQFDADIILENERALLRPLIAEDYDNLLSVATADKDLLKYSPTPLYDPELFKKYVKDAIAEREKKIRYAFSVFDKKTGKYAGSTSMANVSNYDKRLEIGWTWYGKEFQQSGLNRACKLLLLTYIFEQLEFERTEFRIDERNQPSRTAVEKIGGKLEGILRSHMTMPESNIRRSTCYYAILKDEWPTIKIKLENNLKQT